MKEIKLPSGNYIFVEVSDDAKVKDYDIDKAIYTNLYNLKKGESANTLSQKEEDFKIISTTKDITEEECKKYVEGFFKHDLSQNFDCWKNYYNSSGLTYSKATAKKSLQSLIQANGLDVNKNYLILKLWKN